MAFFIQIGSTPLSNEVDLVVTNGSGTGPTGPSGLAGITGPTGSTGPEGDGAVVAPDVYFVTPVAGVSATGIIMKTGNLVSWTYVFTFSDTPSIPYIVSDCPAPVTPATVPYTTPSFLMIGGGGTIEAKFVIDGGNLILSGLDATTFTGTGFATFSYSI